MRKPTKTNNSSRNSRPNQFLKSRLQLSLRRYNQVIAFYSVFITYFTAIIVFFNMRSELMMILYGTILAAIAALALVTLTVLVICSLFPKGRKYYDMFFNYSDAQLTTDIQRYNKIEKRLGKLEKLLRAGRSGKQK